MRRTITRSCGGGSRNWNPLDGEELPLSALFYIDIPPRKPTGLPDFPEVDATAHTFERVPEVLFGCLEAKRDAEIILEYYHGDVAAKRESSISFCSHFDPLDTTEIGNYDRSIGWLREKEKDENQTKDYKTSHEISWDCGSYSSYVHIHLQKSSYVIYPDVSRVNVLSKKASFVTMPYVWNSQFKLVKNLGKR